jgi:hypothetical protein
MELLANLQLGFDVALTLQNVLYCFLGVLLGTLIGVLPGIGPVATIAMRQVVGEPCRGKLVRQARRGKYVVPLDEAQDAGLKEANDVLSLHEGPFLPRLV